MGSKGSALLLALNLLSFAMVISATAPANPPAPAKPPAPAAPPSEIGTCPINVLQLSVCANVLGGLLDVIVGPPPSGQCCTLIQGLLELEATVSCLCIAIKADVLGILTVDVSVAVNLLMDKCNIPHATELRCP
ncbi:unnamed protein product [Sphenostylis stenocarpa]|uniref:Bifunctional inhibitor/plant lipid transfer protein/seed storage helical domain-containing protein n=1 Tax=Sphenostylis stenocarpa TaxID=92480 RepID=A0AA86TBB6_9FABA|nr:unnamed protein product [Sphenostylis stenocarpa]